VCVLQCIVECCGSESLDAPRGKWSAGIGSVSVSGMAAGNVCVLWCGAVCCLVCCDVVQCVVWCVVV